MARNQCLMCGSRLPHNFDLKDLFTWGPIHRSSICPICKENIITRLDFSQGNRCRGCCRQLSQACESPNFIYCKDCYRWLQIYSSRYLNHTYLFEYKDSFRDWLFQYKYHGDYYLGDLLAEDLQVEKRIYRDYHWLVLPSSPASLAQRGFSAMGTILDMAGIPYGIPWEYIGDNCRQARKSRQDRLKLKQPFRLKASELDHLKTLEKIIIFEDVYTTGATLMAAKRTLIENADIPGTTEILSLSLVRE